MLKSCIHLNFHAGCVKKVIEGVDPAFGQGFCARQGFDPPLPRAVWDSLQGNCSDADPNASSVVAGDIPGCLEAWGDFAGALGCGESAACRADVQEHIRRESKCNAAQRENTCLAIRIPCDVDPTRAAATAPAAAAPQPSPAAAPLAVSGRGAFATTGPPPPAPGDADSNIAGPVVGGVAGALIVLAVLAAGLAYYVWRRRRARSVAAQGKPGTAAAAQPPSNSFGTPHVGNASVRPRASQCIICSGLALAVAVTCARCRRKLFVCSHKDSAEFDSARRYTER